MRGSIGRILLSSERPQQHALRQYTGTDRAGTLLAFSLPFSAHHSTVLRLPPLCVTALQLPPRLPDALSRVPQTPFCHLGFQNANCPSGNWLIGQVATGRSCTQFVPATARGDDCKRNNRRGSCPWFRHRRATSWLVAMSLPRMTVVTACRFPIHRFAARKRWQPADERIKCVTAAHAALALNSRSPRPTRVSPLTVSGLAHLGSGGSLLHSFASPKRQRLCSYDSGVDRDRRRAANSEALPTHPRTDH